MSEPGVTCEACGQVIPVHPFLTGETDGDVAYFDMNDAEYELHRQTHEGQNHD